MKLIECIKHKGTAVPEGAVVLGSGKYICAKCWARLINRSK